MIKITPRAGRVLVIAAVSLCLSSGAFGDPIVSVQGAASNGLSLGSGVYAVAISNSNPFEWDDVTISAKIGSWDLGTIDAYYFSSLDSNWQADPGTVHAEVLNRSDIENTTLFTNLVIPAMTTVYFAITGRF